MWERGEAIGALLPTLCWCKARRARCKALLTAGTERLSHLATSEAFLVALQHLAQEQDGSLRWR